MHELTHFSLSLQSVRRRRRHLPTRLFEIGTLFYRCYFASTPAITHLLRFRRRGRERYKKNILRVRIFNPYFLSRNSKHIQITRLPTISQ